MALKKLPKRYAVIVFPLIMSGVMTSIVSAISTYKARGLVMNFGELWLSAWGVSWLVAFPVLMLMLPFVRRIVGMLVEA